MGGRGTYSTGKSPEYAYKCYGMLGDVKMLRPIDERKKPKLPEESHTADARYALLDRDGVFHQYREYNQDHKVVFEIGYHREPSIQKTGDVLHVHIHSIPGVDGHNPAEKFKIYPGHPIYEKYKFLFVGVR